MSERQLQEMTVPDADALDPQELRDIAAAEAEAAAEIEALKREFFQ